MALSETIIFYLLVGAGISVAVLLTDDEISMGERTFRALTAVLFWPLYLPILLRKTRAESDAAEIHRPDPTPSDQMATAITQVEAELDTALNSLDGWVEDVLAEEHGRFSELRSSWHQQSARIRELDRLLAQPEFLATGAGENVEVESANAESAQPDDRLLQSARARKENIDRLRQIRRRLHDDLMGTLAWVRELVTMIHLAKFTGASASRAEELVAQIASAVEGLSEATAWREESLIESQLLP